MQLDLVTQFPAIAMRHLLLFAVLLGFTIGCSKKAPEPTAAGPDADATPDLNPKDSLAKDRAYWFKGLASKDLKVRQDAADELTIWVATDPETVTGLLELLKDKTTTGSGKVMVTRVNSTRELAASILNHSGPKGQEALKDKGIPILREGLNDSDPAVREHTLYTVGTLGSIASPLAPDVLKLCTSPDQNIHRAAFDALRAIGGADPLAISAMLKSQRRDIVRLAAEQLSGFSKFPEEAVPNLIVGLKDKVAVVRTASAAALTTIGPKAAPACDALIEAIKESYPKEVDPMSMAHEAGADIAYWNALTVIGEPAVVPTARLITHTNPNVRVLALQTLGEIGEPSKAVADKIKAALEDSFGSVVIEAACTLCRIDVGKDDAIKRVKQAMDAPNSVAQSAIEAIPRMGDAGKSLIPVALGKLQSDNPYARYAAVGVVGTLDRSEAAKYAAQLGKLATDVGAGAEMPELELRAAREIRQRVAAVLRRLGPDAAPAAAALGKALPNESDSGIREQFIEVLIGLGAQAKPAFPALLKLAEDTSIQPERRGNLFEVLTLIAPESKEVSALLMKVAADSGSPVRLTAVRVMGQFDPMPQPVLTKLIELATTDRATNVRTAALRALAAAGARAKPVRSDVEKIATGTIPEFALPAKVTLAAIDGNVANAAEDVRAGLVDKNTQVRLAAADALLLIGPTEADVPALQKLLGERGDATKEAAAKCIGRIGPGAKDAVPQLMRLLDDRDGAVRVAAATALGEIGPAAKEAVEKLRQMRGTGSGKRNERSDLQAGPAAARALDKIMGRDKK